MLINKRNIQQCNVARCGKDDYIRKIKNLLGKLDVSLIAIVALGVALISVSIYCKAEEKAYDALKITSENNEIEIRRLNDVLADYEEIYKTKEEEIAVLHNEVETLKTSKAKYVGNFKIAYYCACEQCCGKATGITASGAKATDGVTVAADTSILPFGAKLYIEGVGERIVQDRGGAIKGNIIDVYVSSHNKIPSVGVHNSNVWVVME